MSGMRVLGLTTQARLSSVRASASVLASLMAFVLACAPGPRGDAAGSVSPTVPGTIDCGTFTVGHGAYDPAALDCFWNAYSASRPVRWSVLQTTVEGDPIPETITSTAAGEVVVTRDLSADRFSAVADRRVFTYVCAAAQRRTAVGDPTRAFLELTRCRGDGPTTSFP